MENNTTTTAPFAPVYVTGSDKKISCLNKYILVRKVIEEEVSKSGLALSASDQAEIRYKKAIIEAVGASVTPNTLKAGDTILYDKVAGHQIRLNNELYLLIQEKDVVVCFGR